MYEPYVSNPDKWKRHFVNMAENGTSSKKFYALSSQKGAGVSNELKLVTPTEQAVEQAKSELLRSSDPEARSRKPIKRPRVVTMTYNKRPKKS